MLSLLNVSHTPLHTPLFSHFKLLHVGQNCVACPFLSSSPTKGMYLTLTRLAWARKQHGFYKDTALSPCRKSVCKDVLLNRSVCWRQSTASATFSHPSTNQARPCLASKIRGDRARSGWYGHRLPHSLYHLDNNTPAESV